MNYNYKIKRFQADTLPWLQRELNDYTTRHNIKPSNIISIDLDDTYYTDSFVIKLIYWEGEEDVRE